MVILLFGIGTIVSVGFSLMLTGAFLEADYSAGFAIYRLRLRGRLYLLTSCLYSLSMVSAFISLILSSGEAEYYLVICSSALWGIGVLQIVILLAKSAASTRAARRETERQERQEELTALRRIARKSPEVTVMGDYFQNISGTVFNRNNFRDTMIFFEKQDGHVANGLQKVAKVVEDSGSKEAGQLFDGLSGELRKAEPNKPVLRSLWGDLVKIVPDLTKISEATSAIVKLFT